MTLETKPRFDEAAAERDRPDVRLVLVVVRRLPVAANPLTHLFHGDVEAVHVGRAVVVIERDDHPLPRVDRRVDPQLVVPRDERGDDLPCPWCYAPTFEEDTRCSGCGRSFG